MIWSKLRVLVVDDDAFSRAVVVDMLHDLGVTDVLEAGDATVALQSLVTMTSITPMQVAAHLTVAFGWVVATDLKPMAIAMSSLERPLFFTRMNMA